MARDLLPCLRGASAKPLTIPTPTLFPTGPARRDLCYWAQRAESKLWACVERGGRAEVCVGLSHTHLLVCQGDPGFVGPEGLAGEPGPPGRPGLPGIGLPGAPVSIPLPLWLLSPDAFVPWGWGLVGWIKPSSRGAGWRVAEDKTPHDAVERNLVSPCLCHQGDPGGPPGPKGDKVSTGALWAWQGRGV